MSSSPPGRRTRHPLQARRAAVGVVWSPRTMTRIVTLALILFGWSGSSWPLLSSTFGSGLMSSRRRSSSSSSSGSPSSTPLSCYRERRLRNECVLPSSTASSSALYGIEGGGDGGLSKVVAVASGGDSTPQDAAPVVNTAKLQRLMIAFAGTALVILLSWLLVRYRHVLLDKDRIQEQTLQLLERLKDDDNTSTTRYSLFRSLALYSLGMAGWELCSLSTIPVETAAAMVFGWKAAPASLAGKLLGAGTAFSLGRTLLKHWATAKLSHNRLWQQLHATNTDTTTSAASRQFSPWSTAFLLKYSCFPEFVKNFGSSLLDVTPFMFFVATAIHGGSFTLLWTWWGVETTRQLQFPGHPLSTGLKCALVLAGIIGVVVSPALMAWWIQSLRQESATDKK